MITSGFSLEVCFKQEAACALDCLKTSSVKQHAHSHSHTHSQSKSIDIKNATCKACEFAAGKVFEVIKREDCKNATAKFSTICKVGFRGVEDKIQACTAGFVGSCYLYQFKIKYTKFTPLAACKDIDMC